MSACSGTTSREIRTLNNSRRRQCEAFPLRARWSLPFMFSAPITTPPSNPLLTAIPPPLPPLHPQTTNPTVRHRSIPSPASLTSPIPQQFSPYFQLPPYRSCLRFANPRFSCASSVFCASLLKKMMDRPRVLRTPYREIRRSWHVSLLS